MKKLLLIIENDFLFYPRFLNSVLSDRAYEYFVFVVKRKPTNGRVARLRQGLRVLPLKQVLKGIKILSLARLRGLLSLKNSSLHEVIGRNKVPFLEVRGRLNDQHRELLSKTFNPDLIFSASDLIIPSWMLKSCKFAVNMHFSQLPKYAGVMPIFYAALNREALSGVTLHEVTLKIDEGDILGFLAIKINYKMSLFQNYQNFFELSPSFVLQTIAKIFADNITPQPQNGTASYNSWPDVEAWRGFKRVGMPFF
jgi:methionyl-tRNA formyltransferase